MARRMFEVVLETTLYCSVFIEGDDQDEAAERVLDSAKFPPQISVPNGFEVDEKWFVGGVVAVRDDD